MKRYLWILMVLCATMMAAQDTDLTLMNPDSVFTLTDDDIVQEQQAANEALAGTWLYDKPSVQATGSSVLGRLGKPLAKSKLTSKLGKAYKKLQIKKRWSALRLDTDGTWVMTIAGKDVKGKYSYSPSKGSITLRWHLVSVTADVQRDGKHLHLLFDTDRLLTLMRLLSGLSHNDTLKALAFLSENYHDVKVGFRLKQKK